MITYLRYLCEMKLSKSILISVIVILSLTAFSFSKERTQFGLIETQTATTQKNASCDFVKNIVSFVELETDEEQDEHFSNSFAYLSDTTSCDILAKKFIKFSFLLQSHYFPYRNLLYIIFLKILI